MRTMASVDICVFGEVLFDHFPDGQRVLGGAPFNVAWHLQAFGQAPRFISRVGRDPEGEAIRSAMAGWGMRLEGLETDETLSTGRVTVQLEQGQPSYDIVHPCAYDNIEAGPGAACALLYHGSLALRDARSRAAFERLCGQRAGQIFLDVNLRDPWCDRESVLSWMQRADWIKLNDAELALLVPGATANPTGLAEVVAQLGLRGLILTRGAQGADMVLASGEALHAVPKADIEVVDTVGAGDAFAAVAILGLQREWPLSETLERAQAFASAIVGRRGATVDDPTFYQSFVDQWRL